MEVVKLILLLLFGLTFAKENTEERTSTKSSEELNEDGIKLLNTAENFETCGTFSDQNIINGEEINTHSRPWLALLSYRVRNRGLVRCVGTLITKRFVLTAAHCLNGSKGRLIKVRLGEHYIYETRYCNSNNICDAWPVVDFDVEKTIWHPGFYNINGQNDIALIKLARDVEYNDHVRPVCLPLSQELRERSQTQTNFTIIGYAWINIGSSPLVPLQNCNNVIPTLNPKTQICASSGRNYSGVGRGGSPLMHPQYYYGNQRFIQFGILSYGSDLYDSEAVYTNVAEYLPWISQNIIQ